MSENVHGKYVRRDGRAYKYFGRCASEFPLKWEVHVWSETDNPIDVHKNFPAELSGELPNLHYDDLRVVINTVLRPEIERQLEELVEISATTTDQTFVADLNAAKIEGVRASYRPTMAFDSADHIVQLVISMVPSAATLFAAWLNQRSKKNPAQPTLTINNQPVINGENVTVIIQQIIENPDGKK